MSCDIGHAAKGRCTLDTHELAGIGGLRLQLADADKRGLRHDAHCLFSCTVRLCRGGKLLQNPVKLEGFDCFFKICHDDFLMIDLQMFQRFVK